MRDKTHGRIYRIAYVAASRKSAPDYRSTLGLPLEKSAALFQDAATGQKLVAALKNDNMLWRMHAQRLLVTRGQKDVVPALCELVRDPRLDEVGLNPAAIHALWTLHGLGVLDAPGVMASSSPSYYPSASVRADNARGAATDLNSSHGQTTIERSSLSPRERAGVRGNENSAGRSVQPMTAAGATWNLDAAAVATVIAALKHPCAGVRRAAAMVLPRNEASLKTLEASQLLDDPEPQVRLAALIACSEMPTSDSAAAAIFAMLQQPRNADDRWIPDAATAAAARNDAAFLRVVLASYKPAVSAAATDSLSNLVPNPSFEELRDGRPAGWRTVTHGGRGEFSVSKTAHSGGRSVGISSEQGGDVSWSAQVPVKPRTDYRLSGWIKTADLRKIAGARGAMLNIHEMQDPVRGGTRAIAGDNDWTQVDLNFNSGQMTGVTINCLFGGWGRATGAAWFDDIELTPAPGSQLAGEVGRVVRLVTTHYAQRAPMDSIVPTLAALRGASPDLAVPVLDGLVSGWPQDKAPTLGADEKRTIVALMESMPESMRDRLLALAQRGGEPELFGAKVAAIIEALNKQVADSTASDDRRVAAAKRLIGIDSKSEALELVLQQVTLLTPPGLATGFINALTESRNPETGQTVLARWNQLTPGPRRNAVAALLRRPEWTRALLDAVEKGTVHRTDLAADQWLQLKQNPNRMIARRAERLSEAGNAISADREEIVKKLLPLAKEKGDPARGKEVFTATCAVCHAFNGEGGKVGPDLTGIAARDRGEIFTDILDPNRSVEANYRLWNVTTKHGETFSGRLETETQTTVEILDTTAQKHVIQRKDIASMDGSQLSIMPTGFEALPADDLKALLEYLSQPHP